jgi:hypothetical protein
VGVAVGQVALGVHQQVVVTADGHLRRDHVVREDLDLDDVAVAGDEGESVVGVGLGT